jgi:hypothetical protein
VGRPAPDCSNQVHDFDPGLDNGLFWTLPIDKGSVEVNPGSGRASLVVKDLDMEDYFNVINALQDGTSKQAAVSFAVHWAPGIKHFKVRDEATGMAGEFIRNTATMAWSVESADKLMSRDLRKARRAFRASRARAQRGLLSSLNSMTGLRTSFFSYHDIPAP